MRLVFFTESLLPLVDGVSLTLGHLFDALEKAGIEFRIYAPFVPPKDVSWRDRVRCVRWFAFPFYRAYRVSLPGGPRLAVELDAFAPDLVHVVSPTPMAIWAQAWARSRNVPVVATFHTHFVSYLPYYHVGALEHVGWRILRWFYHRCTATYAPSVNIVAELRAHGISNVGEWSRGVDTERFSPAWRSDELRHELGAGADAPLVLLVSRLVKEKDLADLVEMHIELMRRGCRYRLVLVGDGPMRRQLECALPDAHFAGHQCGPALSRWYASADVFVLPSTTETFANVVLEALASGVPAVVVDRGGPPTVVDPGRSGLVARPNDPVDLADRVATLLADPAQRRALGDAGRQRALERTWQRVTAELIDEYRALTHPPQHKRVTVDSTVRYNARPGRRRAAAPGRRSA